ncbi:MAG: YbhB/YbcL family Raf kinase inhibitor-like protein [Phycisphaerae bacterium]
MSNARQLFTWGTGLSFACLVAFGGCERAAKTSQSAPPPEETTMEITITSSAFSHNQPIPRKYTGDAEDVSPPLTWSDVPEGTRELALIMDDPDAPRPEPWVHWVIYKLPATLTGLPGAVAETQTLAVPEGALQGRNSWGRTGYGGPAPPKGHGVHHYHFKLYALDAALDARPGLEKDELLAKMRGHILAEGELVGTYQR